MIQTNDPVAVKFVVGNTYQKLLPSEASYDKLTGRHLKIHDWTLYVDILPSQDPDIIDRVTFDMRDDSFITKAFTCHCPIRIRDGCGSAFLGKISDDGLMNSVNNNSRQQNSSSGQSTSERAKKVELSNIPQQRPHPNQSRWRFSTRQQTYGPVDVQITVRGRGGCSCTIPYTIVLNPGGYECPDDGSLPLFIEKRPHQQLKPLKMTDTAFSLEMCFGLDGSIASESSLFETARSVWSRSKIPITLQLENGETEDFYNKTKSKASATTMLINPWRISLIQSIYTNATNSGLNDDTDCEVIAISSPQLTGGHGLNECYKIIEGLPLSCLTSHKPTASSSEHDTSLHVQIDISTLSFAEIVKVCQNFIKYEEGMDSFVSWNRRKDQCGSCRSNKEAVEGNTNKERNIRISKCSSMDELIDCMNPDVICHYKLHMRGTVVGNIGATNNPMLAIEFRHHSSSKDKTIVTHWIRLCIVFVLNSSRLRSPMALKSTTSIDEEFELLFEYIIKDRALRNFYREKRDEYIREDRATKIPSQAYSLEKQSSDSMSISDESDGEIHKVTQSQ